MILGPITATFKCKDEMYSILPIRDLCGDLFHIR
jgi:hypothetical protein